MRLNVPVHKLHNIVIFNVNFKLEIALTSNRFSFSFMLEMPSSDSSIVLI